jgi:putative membrane protein
MGIFYITDGQKNSPPLSPSLNLREGEGEGYNVFMLMKLLLRTLAVGVAGYLVPGVHITDIWGAVVAAIVLGILNSILRPILLFLTLPVTVLTLGLFALVINTVIVLIAAKIVPGFNVDGFWPALGFSIILAIVNWFLERIDK